jgi:hypothetical protein
MYREKRLMSDKDTREFLRRAKKTWFFDRILAKYGEPDVTGKHSVGLDH